MQTLQSEHGKEGRVREFVARVRQLIERPLLARDLVRDALEARAHEAEGQKIDPGLVEQERGDPERRAELADQRQVVPRPHQGRYHEHREDCRGPDRRRDTQQTHMVAEE